MLKVVLDANIFVSAVLKPHSDLAKIFELVKEGKIRLILSNDILSEIRAVLLYPKIKQRHRRSPKEIEEFLQKTIPVSIIAPGKMKVRAIEDDPADTKYLAAAAEAKADFIISGDRHLKDLRMFQGIRILEPSAFLKFVEKISEHREGLD
ncbi:MAG: putative toxin-antitoxin system toxin component, PIN family [bacterium]